MGIGACLLGCDQVSRPDDPRAPSVSGLDVIPDSVEAAELPPRLIEDSLAQVPLQIDATATDPDGRVDRVVFTIEPSSNPRGTLTGTLPSESGSAYRDTLILSGIPLSLDEVFTVRVFAVDDDSLASNQNVGRLRFIAE